MLVLVVMGAALVLSSGVALADAGDLARSFGKDGKVTTQLGNNDEAYAVVAQPDGKVVAAGLSGGDFALTRYNREGSLDETFGEDGKVFTDLGAREVPTTIVLQTDGKIVVAGRTRSGAEVGDFALARYNPDGSLDETFGGDGTVTTDLGRGNDEICEVDGANALVIQPDGKLVAAGVGCRDFALVRYDPDGSLDETFGEDGVVTTNLDNDNGGFADSDVVNALALQPDGKLVAAGLRVTTGPDTFFYDTALARYNPDGSLDETFGEDGAVFTDFGNSDFQEATALVVQPDGRLTIAVRHSSYRVDDLLARYNPDGTQDKSFGTNGKAIIHFRGFDIADALVLQPDGRFVAGGTRYARTSDQDFALVRYNRDGTPDRSFGRNGRVTTDFGGNKDAAFTLALQPNGRLIAAGESTSSRSADSDFALARYATE